jgi:hypothetical protein
MYGCATAGDSDNNGGDTDSGGGNTDGAGGDGGSQSDARPQDSGSGGDGTSANDGRASDGSAMDVAVACVPVLVADAGSDAASDAGDAAIDGDAGDADDAGVDSGGGVCAPPPPGTCGPGDVSTFQPTWHPPTGAHQGLCTSTQISAYYTACLDPNATTSTCQSFQLSNAACAACISTDDTASSYGPLINKANVGIVTINVGGCIALLEPCNLECAQAYMANDECTESSCAPNCQVFDQLSFDDYIACTQTADTCGCTTENTRAQCANLLTGSTHPAETCITAPDFQTFYQQVAPIFCGQ